MLIMLLALTLIFTMTGVSHASDVTVPIFESAPIQFGDPASGPTWEPLDNGRVIRRTLELPQYAEPVQITARLKLESEGDPWDRFGSVYLVSPTGTVNVELLKFMTGFGTGLPYKKDNIPDHPTVEKWAEYSLWEADLTHLASLLQGEVTIEAVIDTWVNPGWSIDFELSFRTTADALNPTWVAPVFNNTREYWTKEIFASEQATLEVDIPPDLESVQMFYFTSGHGGRRSGDEFSKKDHVIYIDGVEALRFVPWREDGPLFRAFSPTSAKWEGDVWSSDLSRSNWIPGDQVLPMVFELGAYLTPGKHSIRFQVEDMAESTPDNLNYWNTSVVLAGYSEAPTFSLTLQPYLQAPNPGGISVSWAHNEDHASVVKYGTSSESLDSIAWGNTETIGGKVVWHTVQLIDLEPNTTYYYQAHSGQSSSPVARFTTAPAKGNTEPILIGIIGSQTQAKVTEAVLSALEQTVSASGQELRLLMHTGNIVQDGYDLKHYFSQFLDPLAPVSKQTPIQVIPGELEQESMYFYQFVHNDHFEDYLPTSSYGDIHGRLGEECYQFRLGRTLFVVFNTTQLGLEELNWLERVIGQGNQDDKIDNFVVFMHKHLENISSFVRGRIIAHLNKTSKPKLLVHGEDQGFEHGQGNGLDYLSLGADEPVFVLLQIDPKQQVVAQVYAVDQKTKKANLMENLSFPWK